MTKASQARELLAKIPMFEHVSGGDLDALVALAEPHDAIAGDTIFRAGDKPDFCYAIALGCVELRMRDAEHAAMRIGTGQWFGALPIYREEPRAVTASATEVTHMFRVPLDRLRRLLDERPAMAIQVHRDAARYFAFLIYELAGQLKHPFF
ncbi:MAG TPA: cyclic nucleotide-binding domain-containing protein [Candidatus Binatia bacterium]|nr:cyclic nucleotide-binding domain-containing protein [Candidatus Binatia bacterium]